jgi:hypothetical protein
LRTSFAGLARRGQSCLLANRAPWAIASSFAQAMFA